MLSRRLFAASAAGAAAAAGASAVLAGEAKAQTALHDATVVGDTVGDPFKDTAGPSLHILVKLLSTITLVIAPLLIP